MKKATLKILKGSIPPKNGEWKPEWEKSITGEFPIGDVSWTHVIKKWFFVYTIQFTIEDAP